jgi:uncharacterized protein
VEILLVTSRGTGRWVLPKGNVEPHLSPELAAAAEAEEEAGVRGTVSTQPIGAFRYRKWRSRGGFRQAQVAVFPMFVTEVMDQWPEQAQRERRWFSIAAAAGAVDERELGAMLRVFSPPELAVHRGKASHPAGKSFWRGFVRRLFRK